MSIYDWRGGYRNPAARARAAKGAPPPALPLDQAAALEQAKLLYYRGWSYQMIAETMGVYHGHWAHRETWRHRLVVGGVTPRLNSRATNFKRAQVAA